MKLNKIIFLNLFSLFLIIGCGGGGDDSGSNSGPDPEPEVLAPLSATLVFPDDNTECNTGIVNPNNESISTVTFEWNPAENADSYTVTVINLNTGISSSTNSNTVEADITIDRGTPFEWFVTSRAQGTAETALSDSFRFFNEGPGIENFAPFPAEATNPNQGENIASASTVTLEWSAADIDEDITGFEVFFGTETNPTTSLGTTEENEFTDVTVMSNTTYYWSITTMDGNGNSSNSPVFSFRIN